MKKQKELTLEQIEEIRTKDFFDCILPSTIKFLSDHYIVGDSYRCAWAVREYPPTTEEQAILKREETEGLGYDNSYAWQKLIRSNVPTMAESMKIPVEDLRWYAAFHNEGHHPHVHMVAYSVGR